MGLRDRFRRSPKDSADEQAEAVSAPDGVDGADMPTLVQGAPVPGDEGPEDQTFIASAEEFVAVVPEDPQAASADEVPAAPADAGQAAAPADGQGAAPPQEHPPGPQMPARPGFRERGRLRRRLRYLREVRELGYRDLGGLVLDQHRFQRPNEELVDGKVAAIEALDQEMRAIEQALNESTPYTELFIPGLSACPRCGALHGSDANFCPQCGLSFKGPRTVAGVGPPEAAGTVAAPGAPYPAPGAPAAYPGVQPPAPFPGAPAPGAYPPPAAADPVPPAPVPDPVPEAPQPAGDTEIRPAPGPTEQ